MEQGKKVNANAGFVVGKLDADDRIARHARNNVWNRVIIFVRRKGKGLFGLFLVPLITALPFTLLIQGVMRWIFVGVVIATSFWLLVIFIFMWSGVASSIMGIEGESLTADTLRKFGGDEWHLINGMRFQNKGDVDHILVGPGGVLIFETKWSSSRWPMDGEQKRYISGQLDWAMKQVSLSRSDVKGEFKSIPKELEPHAICVLWSAEDSSKDRASFYNQKMGTWCIRGPELEKWLGELRRNVLDSTTVKSIHSEMGEFVWRRDKEDFEVDGPHRRTIDTFISETIIFPAIGFFIPALLIAVISLFHKTNLDLGAFVTLILVGFAIRRRTRLKLVMIAWFTSTFIMVGDTFVQVVRALGR